MGIGRTDEFRKDAVRIALTSGLSRRQVADDLGVGLSTLNKWVNAHRDTDVVSANPRVAARRGHADSRSAPAFRPEAAPIPFLPVEVGRLADPGFSADLRNRRAFLALLQDERLSRAFRGLRCLHRSQLLSQPRKVSRKLQLQTV